MGTKFGALFMVLAFVMVINIPLNSATICNYQQIEPSYSYDGYITSPGYPFPYSSELCIIWVYQGWPGLQVTIRFEDIDIPNYSAICLNDLVKIGPINEHTYCGNINSGRNLDPYTAEFTSDNNLLYIVFNSTSVKTKGRGFKIYFQFMSNYDMPSTTTTTAATTTSTVFYSVEENKSDGSLCNFIINADTGYILTNNEVLECLRTTGRASWQIFYPSVGNTNFKCKIFFNECNVPYPDKLTVYDGYLNENNKLGEYSDQLCPNFLISTSSSLFLEYVRSDVAALPTLNLVVMKIAADDIPVNYTSETTKTHHYESTEPPRYRYIPLENSANHYSSECRFHLSDQSGEINSASIASLVQKSGFCTWLLHIGSTDGQIVRYTLNLERFHISTKSTFVFYDGADMTAPVLGSYLEPSMSFISSQGSVFIYFNPGINVHHVDVAEFFTVKYQANLQCAEGYLACGYEEQGCYRNSDRCDNIWHCPLHGGDERGCFFDCQQEFSCRSSTSICYDENERCDGKAYCPNNMDEQNCDKARCSPDRGLFLCRSGHCIFESNRCNQLSDCEDNSDEDNCSADISAQIIITAVSSSVLCALMLVIFIGCVCKVYRKRNHRPHETQDYETPLTRHLSEMFRHRAPPPPYHEAMLTSRPYNEANLELLDHSDQQEEFGLLNPGYHDDVAPTSSTEPTQRNQYQNNEHSLQDQALTENQHQASASRNEPETFIEVGTLALFSEDLENDLCWGTAGHDLPTDDSELPPYSEIDPSGTIGSYHSVLIDESCHDDSWQRSFANGVFAGDNVHSRSARELLIQMEIIPSDGAQHSASGAHNVSPMTRNTDGMKSVHERHQTEVTTDGTSDMETVSSSTKLSLDSTSDKDMEDTENDHVRESVDTIDDDSDSECILVEDNASDNN